MSTLEQAVREFLALGRVAVVGVSRNGDLPANAIYRKLKSGPREVFAVNSCASSVEGDPCWPSVGAIPGGVQGAVIATPPSAAAAVVDDCAAAGVRKVWFHRAFGSGSLSEEALERCRRHGLEAIPGACPMMYCEPVDPAHKCFRFFARVARKLPEPIAPTAA